MNDIYKAPSASLEIEVENNSGGGKGIEIPDGVKGWSWGAFLLNWIWAIGNRSWLGLLALIPYVGFVMSIMLGVKGREWAWRNKRWDSIEHFNRVQRRWSIWALVIIFGIGGIGIMAAIAIPSFAEYSAKTKLYASLNIAQEVQPRVAEYYTNHKQWPESLTDVGYAERAILTNNGLHEIAIYDEGLIGIYVGDSRDGEAKYLVLEPSVSGKEVQWVCYGQNMLERRLPSQCR